jgi:excisionase family DNA binding protein
VGITLGEVARQFGVSKGSISKAISKGKLSATRSADGSSWDIDRAEAVSFFASNPIRSRSSPSASEQLQPQSATDSDAPATAALEAEIRGLKEIAELMRQQIVDLRGERDDWKTQAQRLALTARNPQETASATPPEMPSGQGVAPPEASAPVDRPAMTRKQRLVKFWFGNQYRRRAG